MKFHTWRYFQSISAFHEKLHFFSGQKESWKWKFEVKRTFSGFLKGGKRSARFAGKVRLIQRGWGLVFGISAFLYCGAECGIRLHLEKKSSGIWRYRTIYHRHLWSSGMVSALCAEGRRFEYCRMSNFPIFRHRAHTNSGKILIQPIFAQKRSGKKQRNGPDFLFYSHKYSGIAEQNSARNGPIQKAEIPNTKGGG